VEKTERQSPRDLKALAKWDSLPRYSRPVEPLRAEIWNTLYWDKLENRFLDGHQLSPEDRLCDCVNGATTMALDDRRGKLFVLQPGRGIEVLAAKKLKPILRVLHEAPDVPVRIVAEHVRHAVTEAAAELLEAEQGESYPPKSSVGRPLQIAV
jgi:hypothetical protein